jgi:hypothetical protein
VAAARFVTVIVACLLSRIVLDSAYAVVLDFEVLQHDTTDIVVIQDQYVEDGYRFVAQHPVPGNQNIFATLVTLQPGFPWLYSAL